MSLLMSHHRRLYIRASNVSALIGHHKWKPADEALYAFWKRHEKQQHASILESLETAQDCETQAQETLNDLKTIVTTAIDTTTGLDNTLDTVQQSIEQHLPADAPRTSQKRKQLVTEMMKQVKKKICTTAGIAHEAQGLNLYEKKHQCRVRKRNAKLYTHECKTKNGHTYVLCGRIDGVNVSKQLLLEHKHRMRRFFTYMPRYERVQLYVYMFLTNMTTGQIVQHYNNEIQTFDTVTFDSAVWTNIQEKLNEFVDDYMSFIENEDRQRKLCRQFI